MLVSRVHFINHTKEVFRKYYWGDGGYSIFIVKIWAPFSED